MKKKLLSLLFCILLPAIVTACSANVAEEDEMIIHGYDGEEEEIILENANIKMSMNSLTTRFSLENKKTGEIWYSNPEGAAEDETATAINKRLTQSQVYLIYSNDVGNTTTIDNFEFSVKKGLYDFTVSDNMIEVNYTIGDIDRVYYIPYAVPASRMLVYYDQMEKSEQRKLDEYYRKYDINKLRATDNKAELLELYPDLESQNVYVLRDTIQPYLKTQIEDLFTKYGYTPEEYLSDLEIYGVSSSVEKPVFNVTIRYELTEDGLSVTVPLEKIEYKTAYPIVELDVLPYFVSGGLEDEGYMFVPDGSGGIINLNNGRNSQNAYVNSVYGWDEALYREVLISDNKAYMPVFGSYLNGSTMLCVIEEGSSYANIKADISGRGSSFNSVFAAYTMIHSEKMDISAKSDRTVLMFERGLPKENIKQNYYFCDESGYMGMAKRYREYLMEKNPELSKNSSTDVPVAVEIVGAINKTQHVVGIPFDLPFELTTYKEAENIINTLRDGGFENVNYRLSGWFNESVEHTVPSKVKPISKLGSKKDLKSLVATASDGNDNFFLEADFLYMKDNTPFDTFSLNADAARYITRERIESYPFSFVWFGERTRWGKLSYLANPTYMQELISNFSREIKKYDANNIAFRTIGSELAGDYYDKRFISRESSMNMQIDKLKELTDSGTKTMINSGYIYAVPYADFITEAPLSFQGFGIIDEEVPFYGLVLHGLSDFAGRPVNLTEDYKLNILQSAESGAGLYFNFMEADVSVFRETKFFRYYSNDFSKWKDTATELYRKYNSDFKDLTDKFIVGHNILSKNVSESVYEDGTSVVVNKSGNDYNHNGTAVPARDYVVIKGGGDIG